MDGDGTTARVLMDLLKALKQKGMEDDEMGMLSSKPKTVEEAISASPEDSLKAKEAGNPLKDALMGKAGMDEPESPEEEASESPEDEMAEEDGAPQSLEDKVKDFFNQNDKEALRGKKGLRAGMTSVEVMPLKGKPFGRK